jgi:hypothetical protein
MLRIFRFVPEWLRLSGQDFFRWHCEILYVEWILFDNPSDGTDDFI